MAKITYEELMSADFGPLRTAADSWRKVPKGLVGSGGVMSSWNQVSKGIGDSDWAGEAADAAAAVMGDISTQITCAADEAHDVAELLDDAHTKFTAAQKALREIARQIEAPGGTMTIDARGRVTLRDPTEFKDNEEGAAYAGQVLGETERHIEQWLQNADETDEALWWALNEDPDGASKGFNQNAFSDVSGAEAGEKRATADGRKAAALAKKGPHLTDAQVKELNQLLARHYGDPLFGATFATGLGAQGTLDFWAAVTDPSQRPVTDPDNLKALQTNLSVTLADATRTHTPAMTAWEDRIVRGGSDYANATSESRPMNFQVMSSLMHDGDYDSGFLQKYGDALITQDKSIARAPGLLAWDATHNGSVLDPNGGDATDPFGGFMDALGHNPSASTDFMSHDEHLDYLAERRWLTDDGQKSFAHALLAGTTGAPFDAPDGTPMPPHTRAEADLMSEVVKHYGNVSSGEEFPEAMRGDLGKMAANYLPDLNRALYSGGSWDPTNGFFPTHGAAAEGINDPEAIRFLSYSSQSPEGYAAITTQQTALTAQSMANAVSHPLHGLSHSEASTQTSVQGIAVTGTKVFNACAVGRMNSGMASDMAFRNSLHTYGEMTVGVVAGTGGAVADAVTEGIGGPFIEAGAHTAGTLAVDALLDKKTEEAYNESFVKHANQLSAAQDLFRKSVLQGVNGADFKRPGYCGDGWFDNQFDAAFSVSRETGSAMVDQYVPDVPKQ